ncbi:MAG: hypothetical protein MMC23_005285 [Stictis urceolatum]|nr:hypothetical protein [Stictis urceolata]
MVGVVPLSENPKGTNLIVIESIFIFLDVLAVGARLWARQIKRKPLEFNDYSIVIALIVMMARTGNEIAMVVHAGFGLHGTEIMERFGPNTLFDFGKMSFANDILWLFLVTVVKLSALDLYTRIFRQPIFVKVTWLVFGICALAGTAFTFVRAFICRPVGMNWDLSLAKEGGICGDLNTMYLALATIDLVLDLLVVFLPLPVIWTLQMAFSKKIAISIIFGLGAAICCITAVRLKFINEIDVTDITFSQVKFNIFAALEPLLGIINACLPVLPPVFAKFWSSSAFMSARRRTAGNSAPENQFKKGYGAKSSGLVSTTSTGRPFERLEDEYPLTSVQHNALKNGGIQVSTQWDVEYSSNKSEDENPGPGHAM